MQGARRRKGGVVPKHSQRPWPSLSTVPRDPSLSTDPHGHSAARGTERASVRGCVAPMNETGIPCERKEPPWTGASATKAHVSLPRGACEPTRDRARLCATRHEAFSCTFRSGSCRIPSPVSTAGKYVGTCGWSGLGPGGSQAPGCAAFGPAHTAEKDRQDGLRQEATRVPPPTRGYNILLQTEKVSVWVKGLSLPVCAPGGNTTHVTRDAFYCYVPALTRALLSDKAGTLLFAAGAAPGPPTPQRPWESATPA